MSMDRISCLPNSIICEILSYLPTQEAVSTSILSRRWRHVWKDLQVIDIGDRYFCQPSQVGKFPFDSLVNTILSQRNADSYPIQKFRLTCLSSEETISTWFNAIIGPHLQELYLHLITIDDDGNAISLPQGLLTCPSLTSLSLKGWINLDFDPEFPDVYLPSLKNLQLDIHNVDLNKLLSGCPVLEDLNLILQYIVVPTIQMPRTLKSLTLVEFGDMFEEINHLVMETPCLEYLCIRIHTRKPVDSKLRVLFSYFPNMVKAHVEIHEEIVEPVNWVALLLQALRETKLLALALTDYATQFLFTAPAFEFPEFHRLLNLNVHVPCFNTKFMLNFLHNCPILEGLVISIGKFSELPSVEYNGPTPPTMVPNCVTSHLKSFEYTGYEYSADEREFIAYLLQRGLVLKTMTIHLKSNLDQANDIVRELSAIPRGSTICQLNFV